MHRQSCAHSCSEWHLPWQVSNNGTVAKLTGCIIGNQIQPSDRLCGQSSEFSPWKCLPNPGSADALCSETEEPQAEHWLFPCHHGDEFVYLPIACLDDGCVHQKPAMAAIELGYQHALDVRLASCGKPVSQGVRQAAATATAVVGGISMCILFQYSSVCMCFILWPWSTVPPLGSDML